MVKMVIMEDRQRKQIRPMKLIENKTARRVSYMKRKDCIKKKTMELATLCGISACMVCFGPNGEVETWPEKPSEVKAVIKMFKEYGENGPRKKVRESAVGLAEKVEGEIDQSVKKDNVKKALLGWDDGWLHGLSAESLTSFLRQLQSKLEALTARIEFLKMVNEQNNAVGKEEVAPYWFDNLSMVPHDPYQPLQTIELPASEHSYDSIFTLDAPMSSAPAVWPLNCYGDLVTSPESFSEVFEETNLDAMSNCYSNPVVGFDAPMSSATPIWPSTFGDEKLEEINNNLNAMNNYYSSVDPMAAFDAPMSSAIWPSICYGDPLTSNSGRVSYPMVGFDAPPSSATPIWPLICCADHPTSCSNGDIASFPWTFDEILEENNLNAMNNYRDQQFLASSAGIYPQPSPLDEVLLASML